MIDQDVGVAADTMMINPDILMMIVLADAANPVSKSSSKALASVG
jgi:hypothetical protein